MEQNNSQTKDGNSLEERLELLSQQNPVTYPEFFWADRLHLGVLPPPFHHHGWQKFLDLVPPDALKMHTLAVPVLRFFCKTFSILRKLNNETLFSVYV